METIVDKAREYIVALQKIGGFSFTDMANLSNHSEQTIRNFLTKKTDKNPGMATVFDVIYALGGDLNELASYDKKKEIEVNATISLKESYETQLKYTSDACETRVKDIKELCEIRISDILKCCEKRVEDIKANCNEIISKYEKIISNYERGCSV